MKEHQISDLEEKNKALADAFKKEDHAAIERLLDAGAELSSIDPTIIANLKLLDRYKERLQLEKFSPAKQANLFVMTAIQEHPLSLSGYLLSHPLFNLDGALREVLWPSFSCRVHQINQKKSVILLIQRGANPNNAFLNGPVLSQELIEVILDYYGFQRLTSRKQKELFLSLSARPFSNLHRKVIAQLTMSQKTTHYPTFMTLCKQHKRR